VSVNLIFAINPHSDIPYPGEKNLLSQSAANFLCMHSGLLESVIMTGFQATEAYLSLYLTKAKCSISRLSKWKKKMLLCELAPVISVHVTKENRHDDANEVCSQYAQPNP
jgi:hypothetical protein